MTSDGLSHADAAGRGRDLPRLTSLRAFAALAVFLYHVQKDTTWAPWGRVFQQGYVGVGFFFILSGFVLAWSTAPGTSARAFYVRRFARVYPNHLVTLLIALVLPVVAFPVTPPAVTTNAALVQAWFPQWDIAFGLNGVSWSLSCEFFFYAGTPFLLAAAERWQTPKAVAVLVGWFVATSSLGLAMAAHGWDIWAYTLPPVRSGEFTLGVLFAMLATRGKLPRVPMWLPLVVLALAWGATYGRETSQTLGDLIFDVPFLLLVVAGASADLRGVRAWVLHRGSMVYAGQVSFAFYLVHELVLLNGNLLWRDGPSSLPMRLGLTVGVTGVVFGLSSALHEIVEKPAQRALRRSLKKESS